MTVWRYKAIGVDGGAAGSIQRGEIAGVSGAEVRASLRRIGLQVIELRPLRKSGQREKSKSTGPTLLDDLRARVAGHIRQRRRALRAELYDSLATMLESGLPLLEAVEAVLQSARGSAMRSMLVQVREALRSGSSLSDAMADHEHWFDSLELAMVRAGQHSGELEGVLKNLALRHERSGDLSHKLAAALAYPIIITIVAVGVVMFLSVKTLPQLVQILVDANVEPPELTMAVMSIGGGLARYWLAILVIVIIATLGCLVLPGVMRRRGVRLPAIVQRWLSRAPIPGAAFPGARIPGVPIPGARTMRRMAVAGVAMRLAELVRSGVPIVDALRVIAPTAPGIALPALLRRAAERVEAGEELAAVLDDQRWFDAEFQRLLEVGQRSGELESLLERIGERYNRRASRLIDQLTALLEPCVILALAAVIGVVVMAAVLPLIRLQEIV